jgi:hypothetical protein
MAATARAVLDRMVASLRVEPHWTAMQQAVTADASRIVRRHDTAFGDCRPLDGQAVAQPLEARKIDLQALQVTAIEAHQYLLIAPAACAREIGGHRQVVGVEGLEQHEQSVLRCGIEHCHQPLRRHHAQDQQHTARAVGTCLQHLVWIDQKILAHRRHAVRCERRCGL